MQTFAQLVEEEEKRILLSEAKLVNENQSILDEFGFTAEGRATEDGAEFGKLRVTFLADGVSAARCPRCGRGFPAFSYTGSVEKDRHKVAVAALQYRDHIRGCQGSLERQIENSLNDASDVTKAVLLLAKVLLTK